MTHKTKYVTGILWNEKKNVSKNYLGTIFMHTAYTRCSSYGWPKVNSHSSLNTEAKFIKFSHNVHTYLKLLPRKHNIGNCIILPAHYHFLHIYLSTSLHFGSCIHLSHLWRLLQFWSSDLEYFQILWRRLLICHSPIKINVKPKSLLILSKHDLKHFVGLQAFSLS